MYNFLFLMITPSDLQVRVVNTEVDFQDLYFPLKNYASESTIQLPASTIKQYSRNGQQPLCLLFSVPVHPVRYTLIILWSTLKVFPVDI